jgi:GAF domain-containing protein
MNGGTLRGLLDQLGLGLIHVVVAPGGLDVPVGHPVITAPGEPIRVDADDLVLAVGVESEGRSALDVVRAAADAGAAAVAFKLHGGSAVALAECGQSAGIAVLGVAPDMAWGQLYTLLRTASSASGEPFETAGDVPAGDLFALANAVALMVGGATTIEDRQSNVLAYSSADDPIDAPRRETILGRKVPDHWLTRLREDGVFRRLWTTEEVVHVDYPDPDYRNRLAIGIRAGGEALGSVWVIEGETPFDDRAEEALREAARIAALHLIRHAAGEGLERRRRGEALRSALEGQLPPELLPESLGMATGPMAVVGFELPIGDPAQVALQAERAVDMISLYCQSFRHQAACVGIGRTVYLLVASRPGGSPTELTDLASDIVKQTRQSLRVEIRAAVGSVVQGLAHVPRSRWEADQVLRIPTAPAVANVEDLRSHVVLQRLLDLAGNDDQVRTGKVAMLVTHDTDHNSAYIETLTAHLAAFGDVRAAADSLAIHPNTFRYRVRRIVELTGLDLDDPIERLVIQFQLELAKRDLKEPKR